MLRKSKGSSMVIITLIYFLATIFACFTFNLFSDVHILLRLFLSDVFATIFVWLFSVFLKNASIYDPYWSVAPIILFTLFIFNQKAFNISVAPLLIAIWIWGIRLTLNWAIRFPNLLTQDWRYDEYKKKYPGLWQFINFFGIQMMPTVIVFLAMIPGIYMIILQKSPNLLTYIACIICIAAAGLQLVADNTLHQFSLQLQNKGKVCNISVWKFSRHPNYLGEITMWWGIYIMLLSLDISYWWTFLGAMINTLLFLFISIPMMEKRQLTNKEEYKDYQKSTGKLLPYIVKRP